MPSRHDPGFAESPPQNALDLYHQQFNIIVLSRSIASSLDPRCLKGQKEGPLSGDPYSINGLIAYIPRV